jgi:hypothetical protein
MVGRALLRHVAYLLAGLLTAACWSDSPAIRGAVARTAADSGDVVVLAGLLRAVVSAEDPRPPFRVLECFLASARGAIGEERTNTLFAVAEARVTAEFGKRRMRETLGKLYGSDVLGCAQLTATERAAAEAAVQRSPGVTLAKQQLPRVVPEIAVYGRWGVRFMIVDGTPPDLAVWDCYNDWLQRELGPDAFRQLRGRAGWEILLPAWRKSREDAYSSKSKLPKNKISERDRPMASCAEVEPKYRPLLDSLLQSSTVLNLSQVPPPKSGTSHSRWIESIVPDSL